MPQLIEAGKIYTAVLPLYRVHTTKGDVYCYSDAELKAVKGKGEITRFKGLGEMNPRELYDTTMNPETRKLVQLTTADLNEALELYDTLMGSSPKARREFILAHKLGKVGDEEDIYDDDEGDDE